MLCKEDSLKIKIIEILFSIEKNIENEIKKLRDFQINNNLDWKQNLIIKSILKSMFDLRNKIIGSTKKV